MRLLEAGVNGQGAHSGTRFQIAPVRKNVRFQAKKMLRFHNGNLYFIPGADQKDEQQISATIKAGRPARLAQQIAALFATAQAAGADFGAAVTPGEIIAVLRAGVHASSNLGMQYFRTSAKGTEREWNRAVAYLQFRDNTLSYIPPNRSM